MIQDFLATCTRSLQILMNKPTITPLDQQRNSKEDADDEADDDADDDNEENELLPAKRKYPTLEEVTDENNYDTLPLGEKRNFRIQLQIDRFL